jgi:multiple sugar transport system permease protein/putative chitobiose transport system permease protein
MKKAMTVVRFFFMTLYALFIFLPFVWMIANGFKPNDRVMADLLPISIKTFIPDPVTLEAFAELVKGGLFRSVIVTMLVSGSTILLGLFINSMAGFSFAKFHFPGKGVLFTLVVGSFLIPFEAIAVPLYITIQRLNWINTAYALVVPAISNGLCIFLFRQFFMDIPDDFVHAAMIDGAGWARIYLRIFLPLSVPVLITAGFLLFLSQWQAFIWPLLSAPSKELRLVQVFIAYLTREEYRVFWNRIAAAGFVIALIPLLVIYPMQKYFIRGVTMSGIKG